MPKICLRYAQDMSKICLRYAQDMPKIQPKYAQDMPQILPTYDQDISFSSLTGGVQNTVYSRQQTCADKQTETPSYKRAKRTKYAHKCRADISVENLHTNV